MQKNITTVGVDFLSKDIEMSGIKYRIQIWDTAGEELFKSIANNFYRECHGVIICYDVTNLKSFKNLDYWMNEVKKNSAENVAIMILATKIDMADKRSVTLEQGVEFASKNNALFYEVSSVTNPDDCINKALELLVQKLRNTMGEETINQMGVTNRSTLSKLTDTNTNAKGIDCCST